MVLSAASRIALAASLCAAIGASGCGTGITPGTGADEPIGLGAYNLLSPNADFLTGTNPIAGVIWTDPLERQADVLMPMNWLRSTIRTVDHEAAYDAFHTDFFRPPPPAAIVTISAAGGTDRSELALGEMVLVDDKNDDGSFAIDDHGKILPPDEYLGATATVLIYIVVPFSKMQPTFPLTTQGTTGYQLVDFVCQGQVSTGPKPAYGGSFALRRSSSLPEMRLCNRTHSP